MKHLCAWFGFAALIFTFCSLALWSCPRFPHNLSALLALILSQMLAPTHFSLTQNRRTFKCTPYASETFTSGTRHRKTSVASCKHGDRSGAVDRSGTVDGHQRRCKLCGVGSPSGVLNGLILHGGGQFAEECGGSGDMFILRRT